MSNTKELDEGGNSRPSKKRNFLGRDRAIAWFDPEDIHRFSISSLPSVWRQCDGEFANPRLTITERKVYTITLFERRCKT